MRDRDKIGPKDQGGIPIVLATARDALTHHIGRKHPYLPKECEGCEFTVDALEQLRVVIEAYRKF